MLKEYGNSPSLRGLFTKIPGLVLAGLLLVSGGAGATTVSSMAIDKIAKDAELVFEGEVIGHETRRDDSSGIINTWINFAVRDVIKGDFNGASIELRFTGGEAGGRGVEISGLVMPEPGERGIYFVESTSRNLLNPLLGWSQGHFLIVDDEGERRIRTLDDEPVLQLQAVSSIPAAIRKPQKLFGGSGEVAAGVVTGTSGISNDKALTVDEFKSRIRDMIEN